MMLYERSCSLLLSLSVLKQLRRESLTERFYQYLEQFTWILHFCQIFADGRLCISSSTKRAFYCSIRRALENNYSGKVSLITFNNISNKMPKCRVLCKRGFQPPTSQRISKEKSRNIANIVFRSYITKFS